MAENRLRTLLREGKPTFGTRVQSSWPTLTEIVGRSTNFDYVEFLAERLRHRADDREERAQSRTSSPFDPQNGPAEWSVKDFNLSTDTAILAAF